MFNAIKKWTTERAAVRDLKNLPAIQMAQLAIKDSWTNNKIITQDFSKDIVDAQAQLMMEKAIAVATSEDPFLANRALLAEIICSYAMFAVLVLEPPPHDDPTGFRGMPGITGELKPHFMALAKKDDGLRQELRQVPHGDDQETIWNFIVFRNRILWAWGSVFQILRFAYNDGTTTGDDWYKPFVAAMFAVQEDNYRRTLSLPLVLEEEKEDCVSLRALWYSTFMNRVTNGDPDPLAEWRKDLLQYEQEESLGEVGAVDNDSKDAV